MHLTIYILYIRCIHLTCDFQVTIIYLNFVDFINQEKSKEDQKSEQSQRKSKQEQGEENRDSTAPSENKGKVSLSTWAVLNHSCIVSVYYGYQPRA